MYIKIRYLLILQGIFYPTKCWEISPPALWYLLMPNQCYALFSFGPL